MAHRATATALPGAHERVHPHTPHTDERFRQERRDPHTEPPARNPAAPDRQAPPHPARPGLPRRPPPPAAPPQTAPALSDRLPRHRPTLAPRPAPPSPRQTIQPKRPGRPPTVRSIQALFLRLAREKHGLGLPASPRRAGHSGDQGSPLHRLANPQDQRDRARTPARPPDLDHLPAARHRRSSPPISSRPGL